MTLERFLDSLNVEYLLRAFDGRLAQLATAAGSRVSRAGVGGDIFPQPARRVRLETPALRGLRNPCSYDFPKIMIISTRWHIVIRKKWDSKNKNSIRTTNKYLDRKRYEGVTITYGPRSIFMVSTPRISGCLKQQFK